MCVGGGGNVRGEQKVIRIESGANCLFLYFSLIFFLIVCYYNLGTKLSFLYFIT